MAIHRPLLNIDRSLLNIDRSLLNIDRPLLNIDRSLLNIDRSLLNIDRSLLNIDRSLLKIDRCLKVAGLINITKNRSFDTNGTGHPIRAGLGWALIKFETLPHDLKELTTKTALGIPAWFAAATALPFFFAPSPSFCTTSDMAR